jgi:aspartate/methionine/tyrosine aminotransferase
MARPLSRFARNDIMSLTEASPDYDLAESVGPDLCLGDLLDGAGLSELATLPLGYAAPAGRPDLRKAIAEQNGVKPDDVVVTVGGMQALSLTAAILCDPGDEVVLAAPLFPNTRTAIQATGAEIKTVPLSFDDGYRLDLDAFRAQLSRKTRLVCLCSPQNPSGVVIPTETIWKIAVMLQQSGADAYLLVDETYRQAVSGDDAIAPSAVTISTRIISTASLSKCHGAPGLRLGWAITQDPALREQLILGKFNSVICSSAIDEALALRVLSRQDRIIGERRDHLAEGLARVRDWVARNGDLVEWVRPHAGALCCVRLRPAVFDEAAVARFYAGLHRQGVRVAPGSWFQETDHVFRLGFGLLPMPELEAGLERMSGVLAQIRRDAA